MKLKPSQAGDVEGASEGQLSPRHLPAKLLVLLLSLLIGAGLTEGGLRLFFKERLGADGDEKSLSYRYDATLGWFAIPNSSNSFRATREITIINNSEGFRAAEFPKGDQPRIIFLGDSYVWGFDVEAGERFTEKLQAKHPEWNVYNLGVSGYGTDQEYLMLQGRFDLYKPRLVFLVYCSENDAHDNSTNCRFGYYKPYCQLNGTRLELHGIPVPRSERVFLSEHGLLARSYLVRLLARVYYKVRAPAIVETEPNPTGAIIRDLQKYLQLKGAFLVVGMTRPYPRLEEFMSYFKIPFVDLSTELRYPGFGEHWTPEGHTFVASKIEEFLVKGDFLEKPVPDTSAAFVPQRGVTGAK
jgi:hypothetical protein